MRLRVIDIANNLRQLRDRSGGERRGAAGKQHDGNVARAYLLYRCFDQVSRAQRGGSWNRVITFDDRERWRKLARMFARLIGVRVGADNDAVLGVVPRIVQRAHGAGRHRDRRLSHANEMYSCGSSQRIVVHPHPFLHGVPCVRKRFRALHRRAMKRGEKGAGL